MPATLDRQPLGQLLVGRGFIQPPQLDRALAEQRRSNHEKLLGEILVEQQLCSDEQVTEALACAYGVPFARVSPRLADPTAVARLPYEFLTRNVVLPMFFVGGVLTVAMPEPANLFLVEEIERRAGCRAQIVAATAADIRATLEAYLPGENAFVVDGGIGDVGAGSFKWLEETATRAEAPADPPVIKLIEYCIYNAIKQKASEIHVEPASDALRIRYRIDGSLVERLRPPLRMLGAVVARLKTLADMDPAQKLLPQDGRIRASVDGHACTLETMSAATRAGEKFVLRVANEYNSPLKLEKLGFGYDMLKQWRRLSRAPAGLLLVCGPFGSGKRAVLYSSLQERNTADANLCTVEERIEQSLLGVNQFPINPAAGFTFPVALAAVLKQEPDVVMISDIGDVQTARIAAQAALGGKLVLAALHATDAPSALSRLVQLGLESQLLGSTVTGVLARRLVRKLCPACKAAYEPSLAQKRQLDAPSANLTTLYRPRGCEACNHLGFAGRIGIHELLIPDDTIRELLSTGAPLPALREHAVRIGFKPLRADGLEKAKAGITTVDEVLRVS